MIAGLIIGSVALARDGDLDEACPSRMGCAETLRSGYDEARTLATVGDVAWISGAAVASVGLILTILLRENEDVASRAGLACSDRGCIAVLTGSF